MNQIVLLFSFIISFAFGIYGLLLYKKVKGSTLAKIIFYTTLSISIFGLHSLSEMFYSTISISYYLSEIFEVGGSLSLLLAAYNICKISGEIFVPEEYRIKKYPIKKKNKNKK